MGQLLNMDNPIQNYAWGTRDTLARLRGEQAPSEQPEAELWVGAHPKSSSRVTTDLGERRLADLIEEDPATVLPEGLTEFPYLLKILAIDSPLSLQVHPSEEQAAAGFEREEAEGISRDAAERNYKDRRSKPETVVAYSPLRILTGIRPANELKEIARCLNLTWLAELADYNAADIVTGLFAKDETSASVAVEATVNAAMDWSLRHPFDEEGAAERRDRPGFAVDAVADLILLLHDAYPGDRGILVAVAMNQLFLKPGESAHTPHGYIHAYIQGTAVEIMNPSDNVMRAGLTPKHVDVKEMLATVVQEQPAPELGAGREVQPGVSTYDLWDPRLRLDRVEVTAGEERSYECNGLAAILCVAGDVEIASPQEQVSLSGARSVLHIGTADRLTFTGQGSVFIAGYDPAAPAS
ncbi:mannose-6-phosphate isomerase, class I [Kocuria sp. HSID16901]|uniref:mannose-6-phosphate isomerase, class I n=1 Tax=Kocuria sp. HSID16901 TaxID=2419505 RepID=UPI000660E861|nr:mannose-6-phosphate isomerase, class I [Kocuria sp. HSID16901]RUQ20930.1 mannose-6-phosphate isomerase, class I [Kocuria sp. HSID16901]